MKVMCITRREYSVLTIEPGEWYEVYNNVPKNNTDTYTFQKDGVEFFCKKDFFITVEEHRDQQINKLI
jgi:hypothetical protein